MKFLRILFWIFKYENELLNWTIGTRYGLSQMISFYPQTMLPLHALLVLDFCLSDFLYNTISWIKDAQEYYTKINK